MAQILVVENDAEAAAKMAHILRVEGHEVQMVSDGDQGIQLLTEWIPDLIVLDVGMPVLDSPGMVRLLNQNAARWMLIHHAGVEDVPVALVSGLPRLGQIAANVNTPYFLGKPYRHEELVALVERILRDRTSQNSGRPK